jgi:hypothetical protein
METPKLTESSRVPVLYIGGATRSGSTLVARVLGSLPGFVTVGEACLVWQYGLVDNRRCSCGKAFASCDYWQEVADLDPSLFNLTSARRYSSYLNSVVQPTRRLPWLWTRGGRRRLLEIAPNGFLDDLSRLYRAIQRASNSQVLVDGSKLPMYEYLLRSVPELRVSTVQLIRDARAVAFSWLRQQRRVSDMGAVEPEYMMQRRALVSVLDWCLQNQSVRKVGVLNSARPYQMRYEDFVAKPSSATRDIARLMSGDVVPDVVSASGEIQLTRGHVFGNPNRFEAGRLTIKLDDEWRTAMPLSTQALITAVASPVLIRYRYPIRIGQKR